MISRIKTTVHRLGLAPYLKPPYVRFVKRPYWSLREQFFPTKKSLNGTETRFVAGNPLDVEYHEFKSERHVIEDILTELDSDDVFYDIGANIGLYTCFVGHHLPADHVYSFEPSVVAFDKLRKNIALNDLAVNSYQIAISDTDGEVDFAVDTTDPNARMSTLTAVSQDVEYESYKVTSRCLQKVVEERNLSAPTVVKIDVEGAEYDVLSGMRELLHTVQTVYCEIHYPLLDEFDTSGEEIMELLRSHGFSISRIHQREDNEFIKATRN